MNRLLAVFLGLAFLPACSLVDIHNKVALSGRQGAVSAQWLQRIVPRETESGWVLRYLGEPDRKVAEGDEQVWVYQFEEQRRRGVRVLLLFHYSTQQAAVRHFYVSMRDGVVQRVWRDFGASSDSAEEDKKVVSGDESEGVIFRRSVPVDPFSEDVIE